METSEVALYTCQCDTIQSADDTDAGTMWQDDGAAALTGGRGWGVGGAASGGQ